MRKRKIPIAKVQEAFNAAIKRRDGRCMVRDYEPCEGELECSHFFTTGSSPALRFYPFNAWAQCSKHHWNHHNKWKEDDVYTYENWMQCEHYDEYCYMLQHSHSFVKYTDELKAEIIKLCNEDRLDELAELIRGELEK